LGVNRPNEHLNDSSIQREFDLTAPALERGTLSIIEAAHLLGLSVKATRKAALAGEIPAIRIGRRWLVLKVPLQELLRPGSNEDGGHM
jgi:excisionase family DNA binding protein